MCLDSDNKDVLYRNVCLDTDVLVFTVGHQILIIWLTMFSLSTYVYKVIVFKKVFTC